MTLKELSEKVEIGVCWHGQFQVIINYRNDLYDCKSNNTEAYDAILSWKRDLEPSWGYTPKQAYQVLWDECKRKNGLK